MLYQIEIIPFWWEKNIETSHKTRLRLGNSCNRKALRQIDLPPKKPLRYKPFKEQQKNQRSILVGTSYLLYIYLYLLYIYLYLLYIYIYVYILYRYLYITCTDKSPVPFAVAASCARWPEPARDVHFRMFIVYNAWRLNISMLYIYIYMWLNMCITLWLHASIII